MVKQLDCDVTYWHFCEFLRRPLLRRYGLTSGRRARGPNHPIYGTRPNSLHT
jgi:hypothetical protein